MYCRESGGPLQERSIPDQQRALQAWADAAGYVVGQWYIDAARSGRAEDRADFQRMISDAVREHPEAVVVWDFARFARDQDAAQFYRSLLRRNGVNVVSLNDQIPDGPMSRIIESVIDFSSEHYSATLAANVKRGHRANLARGFIPGAHPPLGYLEQREPLGTRRNGEIRYGVRWVVDEALAPLIRRAFEMRGAGESIGAIMRETGLHSTRQGMFALLHNPTYKGIYRYGGEEWPGVVPPIVDEATWQAAQINLDIHPRTAHGDYLLTGVLRCGYCGAAMSGFASQRRLKNGTLWRRRYYICGSRNTKIDFCHAPLARADDLEADVLEEVLTSFLAPEPFTTFVRGVAEAQHADVTEARRRQLDGEIAQGERALRDLVALVGQGIAVEVIGARLREQEAALKDLRQQLAALGRAPDLLVASEDELRAFVLRLRDRLTTGDTAVKRVMLREVVKRIVYGDELVIEYKLPGAQ